jgi:hypothetical protein
MIKSRRIRWAGHAAHMGEKRNANRVLVEKPEGKRHQKDLGCRWEGTIQIDLREIRWGGMD